MQITEQQLKQLIREQVADHALEEGLSDWFDEIGDDLAGTFGSVGEFFGDIGEASYESLVGLMVRYILSWVGLDKEGLIATTIGQTVGNITFEEWKSLFSETEGDKRCRIIATKLSEGLVEAIAKQIMWYFEDTIKSAFTLGNKNGGFVKDAMAFLAFFNPARAAQGAATYLALLASLGITEEVIANAIRKSPTIENFINEASRAICKFIDDKLPKFMSQKSA